MNPWWKILAVSALLVGLLSAAKPLASAVGGSAELARKVVHVAMALICLSFPWLFSEAWPVWVLAGIATFGLLLVRSIPGLRSGLGAALHGVRRWSLGELFFAPAVAAVFALAAGDKVLFLIPVLVLGLADGAGALAGTHWGKSRYGVGKGWKSVEGSAAFLFCSVICIAGTLMVFGEGPVEKVVWISLTLGLLGTMAEGLADRGSDNLLLPLWMFFLLERFLGLEANALMLRCAVLVGLLVIVVLAGKRSTLDGAALLSVVLLGYGLAVIGGPWFVVPVLGLFVAHLLVSCRWELIGVIRHGREPILGVAIATLPWAGLKSRLGEPVALLGCTLGTAALLVLMHAGTRKYLMRGGWAPLDLLLKLVVLVVGPTLWMLGREEAWWIAILALGMSIGAVPFDRRLEAWQGDGGRGLWVGRGLLAFMVSTTALLIR